MKYLCKRRKNDLPTREKLHDQIQIHEILERIKHLYNPGIVCLFKDISLSTDVSHLIFGEHVHFAKNLHCIDMPSVFFLYKTNLKPQIYKSSWFGRTSPNAPCPIFFSGSKSSLPRRVRFSRRNSVSFAAWICRFLVLSSSDRFAKNTRYYVTTWY